MAEPSSAGDDPFAAAFAVARAAHDTLLSDDAVRPKMAAVLAAVEPKLQCSRLDRGARPSLSRHEIYWGRLLDGRQIDAACSKREPRVRARAALDHLLDTGWPRMTSTDRSAVQRRRLDTARERPDDDSEQAANRRQQEATRRLRLVVQGCEDSEALRDAPALTAWHGSRRHGSAGTLTPYPQQRSSHSTHVFS